MVHAQDKFISLANEKKQNEVTFENAELIESVMDDETGVVIELYGYHEPISNSVPFAGNGVWDPSGGEVWVMNGNINDWRTDGVYYSTGGDYALVIPPHGVDELKSGYKPAIDIELWEQDPVSDDKVASYILQGPINYPNHYIAFRNIDRFVDGVNKRAEFYTKHRTNYTVLNQALFVQYFD